MVYGAHLARGGAALADAVRALYHQGQSDYFLEPLVLVDGRGEPIGRIQDGDTVIFCCRRGEREVQLTEAFVDHNTAQFARPRLQNLTFVTLTLYHEKFRSLPVAFAPTRVEHTLGEVVSRAGLRQLRVAESEKYAHVTYFFNGGDSRPFPGEDDVRVPSPQGIAFDRVPELSLPQVVAQVLHGLQERYDLIVANFANGDVLGHTQNHEAKIECAAIVDTWLGQVIDAAAATGYVTLMVADHGNLETMILPDGAPHVSHTANLVPFALVDPRGPSRAYVRDDKLAAIAPTVLCALDLARPDVMTCETLLPDYDWGGARRVLLLILDGWGIGKKDRTNPIWLASTPVWDCLPERHPCGLLQAAGEAVGLRPGKPGNSEAGHMNIAAGRVVPQDDVRLDLAMEDGSFYHNKTLCHTIDQTRKRDASLHLIGLLSEKSSHGSIDYPLALLRMAADMGQRRVYLHLILDGRSTEPGSAPAMLEKLEHQLDELGLGLIVSGMGRGIALDRDGDYDKTWRAYDSLVAGIGIPYTAH